MTMLEDLFGGRAAERVLLYLHVYGEGHVQRIAETMELYPSEVRAQVVKFEDLGLLVSREVGRTRLYQWKPGNPFVKPLRALLEERLTHTDVTQIERYFRERQRPRRAGKPL